MKIVITIDIDDDYADPGHKMGLTEEGYDRVMEAMAELGSDIDIQKAP